MPTISVPLSSNEADRLDALVAGGSGGSRADVMRRALDFFAEEEAIHAVLNAEREPSLTGDLRDLAKKLK